MADETPFDSPVARRPSRVFALKDGRPRRLDGPDEPPDLIASAIVGAFATHLAGFGITPDAIPTTFNIFMNVSVGPDGRLKIAPPPPGPATRSSSAPRWT